jgi:hypothetical protein
MFQENRQYICWKMVKVVTLTPGAGSLALLEDYGWDCRWSDRSDVRGGFFYAKGFADCTSETIKARPLHRTKQKRFCFKNGRAFTVWDEHFANWFRENRPLLRNRKSNLSFFCFPPPVGIGMNMTMTLNPNGIGHGAANLNPQPGKGLLYTQSDRSCRMTCNRIHPIWKNWGVRQFQMRYDTIFTNICRIV